VSHKNASLPLLESVTFKNEGKILKEVHSMSFIQECVLIQTCHRVEIYCVASENVKDVTKRLVNFWSKKVGVSSDILRDVVRTYYGKDSLLHLFYLAAGIESMVVGEDQILGQVRKAYVKAKELGTVGLILEKTFMKAVNVGRKIRTETGINEGSVSISSVAVDLAIKEFGSLSKVKALVIGAGDAGSIVAENLHKKGVKELTIANRTYRRGVKLARKVSGKPVKFNQLFEVLPDVDLVVAAVSTDKPVLRAKEVEAALVQRMPRELLIIDISQPRFVDEKVGLLKHVTLRNIDDLKEVVEENIAKRLGECEKAKMIITNELKLFEKQLGRIMVEPLISKICRKMDKIREKELKRAFGKIKEENKRKRVVIERFSRELVERMLQVPLEKLREAVLNNDDELLYAAKKLFGIKVEREEE
jgi:glutamyl-tRNA reductase